MAKTKLQQQCTYPQPLLLLLVFFKKIITMILFTVCRRETSFTGFQEQSPPVNVIPMALFAA
ncbi:hypothetical protein C7N43_25665 [Sphingobacteriales bacterium UPWRP_1]|nr:hypothetical protein C7N43_25665 [Sphingobacteriales bacterium UPWRP_1]